MQYQYKQFKKLAKNYIFQEVERIGFAKESRDGFEKKILKDISKKLSLHRKKLRVLDIGCGASQLTDLIIDLCEKYGHELVVVDCPEMLAHIKDSKCIKKIEGFFPKNIKAIQEMQEKYDCIISYSVLQYIFVDTNIFSFFDNIVKLLAEGGKALIGDIPNVSMRKRFLSTNTGIEYHKKFMKTKKNPIIKNYEIDEELINDAVIFGIMQRIRNAGLQSYLLPLAEDLYYSNRREDILICRF